MIESSAGDIRDQFYETNARHALAWSHQQLGQPAAARAVLEDLDGVFRDRQAIGELHLAGDRFLFAQTTLLLGDTDLALEQLERAVEAGWLDYYFVLHDPRWDPVRDDPRFVRLMDQVKTELDHQRQEVEELDATDDFTARYEDAIARYRSRQEGDQP